MAISLSFSGAWRINKRIISGKILQCISDLKLRAGWGQLGNDDIGIGRALATYSGGAYCCYWWTTGIGRISFQDTKPGFKMGNF